MRGIHLVIDVAIVMLLLVALAGGVLTLLELFNIPIR